MSMLVFCKRSKQLIGRLTNGHGTLPYYFACPHCGRKQKVVHIQRFKTEKQRFVRFWHFIVYIKRTKILDRLREIGYNLTALTN